MVKTIIAMILGAFAIVGLFFIFRALGRFWTGKKQYTWQKPWAAM